MGQNDPQPIPPDELTEFLGPVSPDAIRWTRYSLIGFQLYNGEAISPLSGHVGFYVGSYPDFKPDANSTTARGRLGIFPVKWYRSKADDGSFSQHALVRLDDVWKVDIKFTAKQQADVDRLVSVVSQLPLLTKKPKPIGCLSPDDLRTSIHISYFAAACAVAATLALLFVNWRRNTFAWLPIYGLLLLFHPAWTMEARSWDCGRTKSFSSIAVSALLFAVLICQTVWPSASRRRFLLVLCAMSWAASVAVFVFFGMNFPKIGGNIERTIGPFMILLRDISPFLLLSSVVLSTLCFGLWTFGRIARYRDSKRQL